MSDARLPRKPIGVFSRPRNLRASVAVLVAILLLPGVVRGAQPALPRTIHDITALLDQYKPDPTVIERARAKFDQSPPVTQSKRDLAQFYLERARAAEKLGLVSRQIADLREAASVGRGTDSEQDIFLELSHAENYGGNFRNAIQVREEFARVLSVPGRRVGAYCGLAIMYARTGDIAGAKTAFANAESAFRNVPSQAYGWFEHNWKASIETARGALLNAEGKYGEADMAYRAALREWELDLPVHQQRLVSLPAAVSNEVVMAAIERVESYFAENLMQQRRLLEAEMAARGLIRKTLTRTGRYSPDTGNAVWTLARVIAEQGRYREATMLARAALESHERAGAAPQSYFFASARRNYAGMLVAEEKWEPALFEYEKLREALSKDAFLSERLAAGDIDWALALMRTGKAESAVAMLEQLLAKSVQNLGEIHYQTAEVRGFYAMALSQKGERERAYREIAKAIAVLLSGASADFDQEARALGRSWRLRLIIEAYIALLFEVRGTQLEREARIDAGAEAFRLADTARGASVQLAVAQSAARFAVSDPQLAELARKEQDLQYQLSALYRFLSQMVSASPDQQLPQVVAQMRVRIGELKTDRKAMLGELERRFPAYVSLINPKPVTVEEARAALRDGEVLLSALVTGDRTYVWAVPKQGQVAFHAANVGEKAVNRLVGNLRKALDPGDVPLEKFPSFDIAAAHRLYAGLLKPVENAWHGAHTLIVVANGALAQLPFSLLPTEPSAAGADSGVRFERYKQVPWLIRQVAVTQLPAVSTLVTLRALPSGNPNRAMFVGFGDPQFDPNSKGSTLTSAAVQLRNLTIPRVSEDQTAPADWIPYSKLAPLPDTRDEILAIAAALKADLQKDVFLGKDASKQNVKSAGLANRRIVVFATHGLIPGDFPNLDQPALALAAPDGNTETGLLTLEDILGLKLDADWIVLSACNTAAGDGAGADAISGLGRGFFYAGSRALLVTHWPVETRSARLLMTKLFERYAAEPNITRADALRQAELALIDENATDPASSEPTFSYAHPLFWAPYVLVGDGGR